MIIPLWVPVLLPVFFGILAYALPGKFKRIVALVGETAALVACLFIFLQCKSGPVSLSLGGWNPPVGIMLHADEFASVMILLASFLFLMLTIFESSQKSANKVFYMLFMILEGLLCGIFLLDDLFSIFVLIEVSTIVVSLLIMFNKDSRSMYDGLIYLLISIFSATFLLFGLALLYKQTGTFSLSILSEILPGMQNPESLFLPYALILTSVCLKAALMPLFSWLPKAHATPGSPSVVSAILSGLYVKTGIYLFIRCQNAFSVIDTQSFFLITGIVTAVIGFIFAIAQSDIKLILSYHTVSQLGLIMIALNMGDETAMWGGLFHVINHSIFKTVLFLGAGEIIHEYKTRNIYEMKGVAKRMPFVTAAMVAAILGITGAPLFNGSISKYLISHGTSNIVGEIALIVINMGTIISFIKLSGIFFGSKKAKAKISPNRNIVCILLGAICLVFGIFGAPIINLLFGISIEIDISSYIMKSIVFFASVAAAWLIYRYLIKGKKLWNHIRSFDLGFNSIALSVVVFFGILTGYLFLM